MPAMNQVVTAKTGGESDAARQLVIGAAPATGATTAGCSPSKERRNAAHVQDLMRVGSSPGAVAQCFPPSKEGRNAGQVSLTRAGSGTRSPGNTQFATSKETGSAAQVQLTEGVPLRGAISDRWLGQEAAMPHMSY
jgi:hypothetical protein